MASDDDFQQTHVSGPHHIVSHYVNLWYGYLLLVPLINYIATLAAL
jgi:hypothetical protein